MNKKEKLEARKARLEAKKAELMKRADDSQDVEEVRALSDRLRDIVEDLRDVEDELLAIAEEDGKQGGNGDGDGAARSFNPLGTYGVAGAQIDKRDADVTNTMEYRSAFAKFVANGTPIPVELRDNATTLTSDVASVIPTVVMNRIIERITACGMILPLVTRTAYASGLVIPTSSVKPVASWVSEGTSSDAQKKTTGTVTFSHFKLRCEVSVSAEVDAMAISAFEEAFIANVADAMTVAIEEAIIAGAGTAQPTGILTQNVPDGQSIAIADTNGIPTYAELVAAEAALPVEYENTAKWFMTKKQFMNFLAMTDSNGQPIARVNYGVEGKPERVLLGREVVVHPYATQMGSYAAAIYDFRDYVLNTVYDLGIERKRDWDNEDIRTKAVMAVDGKPVDNGSLVVMTVSA